VNNLFVLFEWQKLNGKKCSKLNLIPKSKWMANNLSRGCK
jgi:hypothetical protein